MGHHGVQGRLVGGESSAVSTGDVVTNSNSNIDNNEGDEQRRRQLRHNCSWNYSTTTDYKICEANDFTSCLKMTSTTNTELATYTSGDDKFHWKMIEVTISGGKQRVRLQNQSFNHNLAAEDIDGNDGATAFKISEGSSPCDTSATVKISYLDPSGTPSNDWLKATSGNSLVWKAKSGQGTTFRVLTA